MQKKPYRPVVPKPLKLRKIVSPRPLTLGPDGVELVVDWNAMKQGMSVFVPCLDIQQCLNEFNHIADRLNWTYEYAVRIEAGKMGVRFWRLS